MRDEILQVWKLRDADRCDLVGRDFRLVLVEDDVPGMLSQSEGSFQASAEGSGDLRDAYASHAAWVRLA